MIAIFVWLSLKFEWAWHCLSFVLPNQARKSWGFPSPFPIFLQNWLAFVCPFLLAYFGRDSRGTPILDGYKSDYPLPLFMSLLTLSPSVRFN
jgi:hypothetical protein